MKRTLNFKWFTKEPNLVDFVNKNNITKENIESIQTVVFSENRFYYTLFYWTVEE
jgi:hypothetical protein